MLLSQNRKFPASLLHKFSRNSARCHFSAAHFRIHECVAFPLPLMRGLPGSSTLHLEVHSGLHCSSPISAGWNGEYLWVLQDKLPIHEAHDLPESQAAFLAVTGLIPVILQGWSSPAGGCHFLRA